MNYKITIKDGKEKQLLRHHPWVFSGAIKSIEPKFDIASWADVYTEKGTFIAKGWYDEKSHIVLHLLSWDEKEKVGLAFVKRLAREAVMRRRSFFRKGATTNAFRLIHGEADSLPGFAVDVYASTIRIILSSRFASAFLQAVVEELDSLLHPSLIVVSSDPQYTSVEGMSSKTRYFISDEEKKMAEDKIEPVTILENGIYYEIPGTKGQKSGFYIDQRDNRLIAEGYAEGRTCLDVCSYTGAFTLHLLKGGAESVKAIDSSESALRHLLYQVHLNEDKGAIPSGSREKVEILSGDCFELLRTEEKDKYDLIVLDPPRDGIHPKALPKILSYGVDRIVYISCKMTSLARDLAVIQVRSLRLPSQKERVVLAARQLWRANLQLASASTISLLEQFMLVDIQLFRQCSIQVIQLR